MAKAISIFIILLWSVIGCSQDADLQISSQEEFAAMCSQPLYQKYGQVSSVKVVFDTRDDKLYFLSSSQYQFHHVFCEDELGYRKTLSEFNEENYSAEKSRPFLLANINSYRALDKFGLELGPSDRMNAAHLEQLFFAIQEDVFFKEKFYLMMSTSHVNGLKSSISKSIPLLTPDEVYANQIYQPISKTSKFGRVKVIREWEEDSKTIRSTDILLLEDIPLTFPLVAGVVVTKFQTPLSHVSLLGHNRKIPVCAYTDLFSNADLLDMEGKVVEFTVEQDTFYLRPSNVDLTGRILSKRPIRLKCDTSVDTLIRAENLREKHGKIAGNKAANFGELLQYSKKLDFKTPESAFAIPFGCYKKHSDRAGIRNLLTQLLQKDNLNRSREAIEGDLQLIRWKILSTPIDSALLSSVVDMIVEFGDYRRMRFRSSTNAEDREGFSGAGLYTSKTGEIGNPKKPIDQAIKKVWASLWFYGAFMEREAFNLDHRYVAMGILVHRSFPDEEVNGVAITTNLYRDNYMGFVINAQLGNENVVQPTSGIECDQFICYPDKTTSTYGKKKGGLDIITYSSLNKGKLTMTESEIQDLANVLEQLKRRYLRKHYTGGTYFNFGLDVEFKLDKDTRQLYIKQMRLFNN